MAFYNVTLRDTDGHEIATTPDCEGMKNATERAKYYASEIYARSAETTHETLRSDRVEITNDAGEILKEIFLK